MSPSIWQGYELAGGAPDRPLLLPPCWLPGSHLGCSCPSGRAAGWGLRSGGTAVTWLAPWKRKTSKHDICRVGNVHTIRHEDCRMFATELESILDFQNMEGRTVFGHANTRVVDYALQTINRGVHSTGVHCWITNGEGGCSIPNQFFAFIWLFNTFLGVNAQ